MAVTYQKIRDVSTAGNSSAIFVNTTNVAYTVAYGEVCLSTANSSIVQRSPRISIIDENNVVFTTIRPGSTIGLNVGSSYFEYAQGVYKETLILGSSAQVAMPMHFIVPSGWKFKVDIINGLAVDTFDAKFMLVEHFGY